MPAGRPTDMDRICGTGADGQPETVVQRIISTVALGCYLETGAGRAGVSKSTVLLWCSTGARAIKDLSDGRRTLEQLTPHDVACMEFSRAIDQAEADGEARLVAQLERASRDDRVTGRRTTTKRDAAGNIIESSTIETIEAADLATVRWRLERRAMSRWGRQTIEVTGADGGPVEISTTERADSLAAALAEFQQANPPEPASNGHNEGNPS